MRWPPTISLCSILFPVISFAVQIIDNGLAPPEIVHQPLGGKPRCLIKASSLDLIFILDSSGSLKNSFQDEIDIIRRIVKHVTIGETATRVMLIQFSGTQHLEFNFHKFTAREEIVAALDVLRHVSGITRIGGAFKFAIDKLMDRENGMRDASVQKIVYLLSDGRTHDYPLDWEMSALLRRTIPNVEIWAYGTGDYVAMPALLNYTQDASKVITNQNLNKLESIFDHWKGTEVCEILPACIKGSDKPLDLLLVIDASESVDRLFYEQVKFAIERIVGNVNIHPEAVRMALITFSGKAFLHFDFHNPKFCNNTAVVNHLNTLRSIKGTTSTHLALDEAYLILQDEDHQAGTRAGVPKLVIVMTDGHSHHSPKEQAKRLRDSGVDVLAVSVMNALVDEDELFDIAGDLDRVFTPKNIHDFETAFMQFIGFGCPGMELGPNATPKVRGATDVKCDVNSLSLTVRTQRPMSGLMYAQLYHNDQKCVAVNDGSSREVTITFLEGTCGLSKTPSVNRDGYYYNLTVILQFHPLIMTRADQGLDVNCFHAQPLTPKEIGQSSFKKLHDTTCSYRLHRYSPEMCVVLDAKVGETLYHKWECDTPPNYQYLVHDCYAKSEKNNVQFIDEEGCEIDVHFLETPNYSRFNVTPRLSDTYVWQEMSVFKFPGDSNIQFSCKVSLCDMDGNQPCIRKIGPVCKKRQLLFPVRRIRRQTHTETKEGFAMTMDVETRTLNILDNEGIRPRNSVKYCDIF